MGGLLIAISLIYVVVNREEQNPPSGMGEFMPDGGFCSSSHV